MLDRYTEGGTGIPFTLRGISQLLLKNIIRGVDEVDDYDFYRSRQTGAAFIEKRLRDFWGTNLAL
jgi:hypothetical protein